MGEGSYITLFSPNDVTEFHRMKYGGGGIIKPCFHRVTSNNSRCALVFLSGLLIQTRIRNK